MTNIKDVKILSSLEKIYDNDKMPTAEYKGFSMLKNEKKSFQLAIETTEDCEINLVYKSMVNDLRIYTVWHV